MPRKFPLNPLPETAENLEERGPHYCLEFTATYPMPVMRALEGHPYVVNPLLARSARRKTDVLDARLLAYHSMTGIGPKSDLATDNIQTLCVMIAMRRNAPCEATKTSNRINNFLLRYGLPQAATTRFVVLVAVPSWKISLPATRKFPPASAPTGYP